MILSGFLPIPIRIELRRFLKFIQNRFDKRLFAVHTKTPLLDTSAWIIIAERQSEIVKKVPDQYIKLQENKKKTLRIAGNKIHGLIIKPGEYFSFWKLTGRPSRLKGYTDGFEIRSGKLVKSIAGGLCQITNALCWCAAASGINIIERHRHAFDLFKDDNRDVPFGSGATVLFNFKDFIFQNTLSMSLQIECLTDDRYLYVRMKTPEKTLCRIEIQEKHHQFYEIEGIKYRKNEIWRIFQYPDGSKKEELLFQNEAKVLYDF